jgi:hypothetical protein
MAGLDSINTLLSDGRTSVIRQKLVVTTLSYISTVDRKRSWLAEGAKLRQSTNLPWLVIHHHPPTFSGSAGPEELSAGKLLKEFWPTLWLAGRFFHQAHPQGYTWMQTIDHSLVLNIAQGGTAAEVHEAAFPNHVILDMVKGVIQWNPWRGVIGEEKALKL